MSTWREFLEEAVIRNNIAAAYAMPLVALRRGNANERLTLNQHLQNLFDSCEISINMRTGRLDNFVREGVYKTAFDLPPVAGIEEYLQRRGDMEAAIFGEKSRLIHPVAGYASNTALFAGAAGAYGKIRVVLKPEIRQRTTITRTDLMNMLAPRVAVPIAEIDAVVFGAIDSGVLLQASQFNDLLKVVRIHNASEYIEAQIHGGVTSGDILRLEPLHGIAVGEETKRWAQQQKIEIVTVRMS